MIIATRRNGASGPLPQVVGGPATRTQQRRQAFDNGRISQGWPKALLRSFRYRMRPRDLLERRSTAVDRLSLLIDHRCPAQR